MKKTLLVITALALSISMMVPTWADIEKEIVPIMANPVTPVEKAIPVRIDGNITEVKDNKITVKEASSDSTIVLNIADTTYKVDAVTGLPLTKELKVGDSIAAYYGPATTMSLPPQSTAVVIFANIPQDIGFPFYTRVEEVRKTDKGIVVTTDNGSKLITILKDTNISPFVTKNIIHADQITVGSELVLWYNIVTASIPAQSTATKVVALSIAEEKTKNVIDVNATTGQITVDGGAALADIAIVEKDVTLIPLRVVADALGFTTTWLNDTRTAQLNKGAIQATASLDSKSYSFSKMLVNLEVAPILKDGKTYVPANFFSDVLVCTINVK